MFVLNVRFPCLLKQRAIPVLSLKYNTQECLRERDRSTESGRETLLYTTVLGCLYVCESVFKSVCVYICVCMYMYMYMYMNTHQP